MDDLLEETRKRLERAARATLEVVSLRPNVAGVVAYGSLARGGLTRFSDVDLAVICDDPVPEHWVEHRLTLGDRVDLLIERWDRVRALPDVPLYDLYEGTGISGYLMESLLLGGAETVLYDPYGEVRRVKAEVQARFPYERLSRYAASGLFHYLIRERLPEVESRLQKGEATAAVRAAVHLARVLGNVLRQLTSVKVPEEAADRLGLEGVAPALHRLNAIALPGREEMGAHYRAARAFLDLFLERVYGPTMERMRAAGIVDPPEWELTGAYSLWWEDRQPRLWELDRAVGEWGYSLDWWGVLVEEGKPERALDLQLAGHDSGWYAERWDRLGDALADRGLDPTDLSLRMRIDPEYDRRASALDAAHDAVFERAFTPEQAGEAVALARELSRVIAEGANLLSPEEMAGIKHGTQNDE